MPGKQIKTNVMRLMDAAHVPYEALDYEASGAVAGADVARVLEEDPACVFKTLVTRGGSGEYYVFMVPVTGELDLKKAARASGEKRIDMLPARELLPLTGYIHGGCSPIGMKKTFPTFLARQAGDMAQIYFSAGKVGRQVRVAMADLPRVLSFTLADLTE